MSDDFDCLTEYRPMEEADYPQVSALWHDTEGMGLDPVMDSQEGIKNYLLLHPGCSWVTVCDGEIVGTVLAGTDGRRGYLMHLAVSARMRGRGIGRKLVDRAVNALERRGINKVHVFVFKGNEAGADFWRHIGWQGREDLLMLSLELDGANPNCCC